MTTRKGKHNCGSANRYATAAAINRQMPKVLLVFCETVVAAAARYYEVAGGVGVGVLEESIFVDDADDVEEPVVASDGIVVVEEPSPTSCDSVLRTVRRSSSLRRFSSIFNRCSSSRFANLSSRLRCLTISFSSIAVSFLANLAIRSRSYLIGSITTLIALRNTSLTLLRSFAEHLQEIKSGLRKKKKDL
jgi:hypothetical protein